MIYRLLILMTLVLCSCFTITKRPQKADSHIIEFEKFNACGMYTSPASLARDSIEISEILNSNDYLKRAEVERMVFAKSSVELMKTNRFHTDFETGEYLSCSALKMDSLIVVNFEFNHRYAARSGRMEWVKPQIRLLENDFEIVLRTYSDVGGRLRTINKHPTYFYEKLELNRRSYEAGDTICGRMAMRNRSEKGELFIVNGNFKVILKGETELERRSRLHAQERKKQSFILKQ